MSSALQLPWPWVPGQLGAGLGDDPFVAIQQNLDAIALAIGDRPILSAGAGTVLELATSGTVRKVAFGRGTCHFSTSAISDTTTQAHGLGVTPAVVIVTMEDSGTSVTAAAVYTTTSTDFTFKARDVDGAARGPGNLAYNWLAIG